MFAPLHQRACGVITCKDRCVDISVIIPTFNRASLLSEAVYSSLHQKGLFKIEVIIVDDGSTDDTASVAMKLAERFPEVKVVRQPNGGPSAARNVGIAASKGRYLQFLDSDDVLNVNKVRLQISALEEQIGAQMCYCTVRAFVSLPDDNGSVAGRSDQEHTDVARQFLLDYPFPSLSPIYRRELCVNGGGWDERLRLFEDWEFNFRMALLSGLVSFVPRTLAYIRVHSGDRLSVHSRDETVRGHKQYLDTILEDIRRLAPWRRDLLECVAGQYLRSAGWHARIGCEKEAGECLRTAAKLSRPWPRRAVIVGVRRCGSVWTFARAIAVYDVLTGVMRKVNAVGRRMRTGTLGRPSAKEIGV